ncbi:MAG: hypothetical protein RL264_3124 [Bacteroidota bacterium]|jgi:holo-[acyl-carrier protein] synthase
MASVGIDIEEVQRFKNLCDNKPTLLQKIFSDYEWTYAKEKNTAQTLTGIWCAKEAVVKALYAIGFSVLIRNVHITHNSNGVPLVHIIQGLNEFDVSQINLSISHTVNYAVAVCIINH